MHALRVGVQALHDVRVHFVCPGCNRVPASRTTGRARTARFPPRAKKAGGVVGPEVEQQFPGEAVGVAS